jgi:DNA-binding CsgD family transcriptional regulator
MTVLVEEIRGPDEVRSRLDQLARAARRSACSVNPGPPLPAHILVASRALDEQSRARGVCSRSVFGLAATADAAMGGYLADVAAAGDEVRVHPDPPLRLLLIDGECAVIPVAGHDHAGGAYVLHGRALVAPLRMLFEQVWTVAQRFTPDCGPCPDEARLRQVVTMLAEGHKDEAVARRMNISVRTTRRLITASVERLSAQSRFQAGVMAVRAGWVAGAPPPEA